MFEKCLREIEATPEQLELIRDFSPKYQFRFVVLHGRKVNEHRERSELDLLRRTHHAEEDQFRSVEDRRRKDLEEKMAELEASPGAIKMPLSSIDRYISEK